VRRSRSPSSRGLRVVFRSRSLASRLVPEAPPITPNVDGPANRPGDPQHGVDDEDRDQPDRWSPFIAQRRPHTPSHQTNDEQGDRAEPEQPPRCGRSWRRRREIVSPIRVGRPRLHLDADDHERRDDEDGSGRSDHAGHTDARRGQPYRSQIRCHVVKSGTRIPASSSRHSRTVTPHSQAARHTRRPSRFRPCSSIRGNAASVGTARAYRWSQTSPYGVRCPGLPW
jgi:hypothetical protein